MALTAFPRDICRLLADDRLRSGESYVAGAAAPNELLQAPRQSRDMYHEGCIRGTLPRIVGQAVPATRPRS